MRKTFKSLPKAEFPTLVALADHLADGDSDGLFEFGIELVLRGIEERLKRRARR
jgi:hypothetical protein